jgi:hypothetical protein
VITSTCSHAFKKSTQKGLTLYKIKGRETQAKKERERERERERKRETDDNNTDRTPVQTSP